MNTPSANNDNFVHTKPSPLGIDDYYFKKISLSVAFDRFVEGPLFCTFLWNLQDLSYEAKNFLIQFITKDERAEKLSLGEISSIYREIHTREIQMTYEQIVKYIPFFSKFLETKRYDFREIFVEQVNKELTFYITSVFEIYFMERNWRGFENFMIRNDQSINDAVSNIIDGKN